MFGLHDAVTPTGERSHERAPSVVSLFAGCGGLDHGFETAGFNILTAADNDPAAVAVYNRNLASRARVADVTDASWLDGLRQWRDADVLLGGFPCQGFSKAGPKRAGDERNTLYKSMFEAVRAVQPTIFVAENVDGMAQNFNGQFLQAITRDSERLGYRLDARIVNAAWFGVAQHRRRIVFIGLRDDIPERSFRWPTPTHRASARNGEKEIEHFFPEVEWKQLPDPRPISDAIGDLRAVDADVPDHRITGKWPQKYAAIFDAINPGQKLCDVRHDSSSVRTWDIPAAYGLVTEVERHVLETIVRNRRHKRYGNIPNGNPLPSSDVARLSGVPGVEELLFDLEARGFVRQKGDGWDIRGAMFCSGIFKRPLWEEPSPTVLTNFHNPRYFLHPLENRPFTLRECARLQGFSDEFEFSSAGITLLDGYKLVGNAVPPPLASRLAASVAECLANLHARRGILAS